MRYVVIFNSEIVNAIQYDGISEFTYPFDHDELIQSDELQIGMKLIDGIWQYEQVETDTETEVSHNLDTNNEN